MPSDYRTYSSGVKSKSPPIQRMISDSENGNSEKLSNRSFPMIRGKDITAVNNGMLSEINLNTLRGRKILTTYYQFCQDLGGEDYLSLAQKEIVRRAATLAMICADLEYQIINKNIEPQADEKGFDDKLFGQYNFATKTQMNLLKMIGLQRRMRPVDGEVYEDNDDSDDINPVAGYAKRVNRAKDKIKMKKRV